MTSRTTDSLRIVVLGYMVRGPVGGMAWSDLHYLLGLQRLGHDVYFVEDSDDWPSCWDPSAQRLGTDPSYGLAFAARVFAASGLGDRWAYHDAHASRWFGPCADRILGICARADLLLNLGGVNPLRPWFLDVPVRALIDKDPAFTQVRHLEDPAARDRAVRHTVFFSFGENIATCRSEIPDDGLPWEATRHPVCLDAWPAMRPWPRTRFTTVMQWDSYPPREHDGRRYGMKSESFGSYVDLPGLARQSFELTLSGPTAPRALLSSKGWAVRDPLETTADPWSYRRYIQHAKAEFTVAKHGYVVSHSGWFSERSACYLASGRPVLTEDTDFSTWLPTGSGVLAFSTPEGALAGIREIDARYGFHSAAARAIAEDYFDSRKVLPRLIELALQSADPTSVTAHGL